MKLRILPSFYILAALIIALGYTEQFFLLFIFVTVHELAHIAAALALSKLRKQNVELRGVIVTPLGEAALFTGLAGLRTIDRVIVSAAGPAVNVVIALIAYSFDKQTLFVMNMSVALVNCLPAFPLDGGRVLYQVLSDFTGCMNASKTVGKIGWAVSVVCFVAGLAQVALYPYNITLVCMSQFLRIFSVRERAERMLEVYNAVILGGTGANRKRRRRKRLLLIREDDEVITVFNALNMKSEIAVKTEKRLISEAVMIEHIRNRGLIGTISSVKGDLN